MKNRNNGFTKVYAVPPIKGEGDAPLKDETIGGEAAEYPANFRKGRVFRAPTQLVYASPSMFPRDEARPVYACPPLPDERDNGGALAEVYGAPPVNGLRFCVNCGERAHQTDKFCRNCGQKLPEPNKKGKKNAAYEIMEL
ncbi:MAG: zinc ribbon domain-containing protein [Clostridia bacterium]|nr:zinc ribbon domain-containing protein [Clostridia bacterium]